MAGRGQRIRLASAAPVAAIQVKVKRIGQPGPLCWEAGTAWDRNDLGQGQIAANRVPVQYERFVTFAIRPARTRSSFRGSAPPRAAVRTITMPSIAPGGRIIRKKCWSTPTTASMRWG